MKEYLVEKRKSVDLKKLRSVEISIGDFLKYHRDCVVTVQNNER